MSKEVELDNSWYKCPVCGTWNDVTGRFEEGCEWEMRWFSDFEHTCIKCRNKVSVIAELIPTFSIKDSQGNPIKSVCEDKME